jgi:hypothetical protein
MRDNSHFTNWETRMMYESVINSRKTRQRYFSLATRFYKGYPIDRIVYDMQVELQDKELEVRTQGTQMFHAHNVWEFPNYWEIAARIIDALRESGTLEKV